MVSGVQIETLKIKHRMNGAAPGDISPGTQATLFFFFFAAALWSFFNFFVSISREKKMKNTGNLLKTFKKNAVNLDF